MRASSFHVRYLVSAVLLVAALILFDVGLVSATQTATDDSAGAAEYTYDAPVDDAWFAPVEAAGLAAPADQFGSSGTSATAVSEYVYDPPVSFVALRGIPRGFGNTSNFGAFGDDLYSGLRGAGYDDVTAIDVGRVSDFDIALASPQLLDRASALGIGLRSAVLGLGH